MIVFNHLFLLSSMSVGFSPANLLFGLFVDLVNLLSRTTEWVLYGNKHCENDLGMPFKKNGFKDIVPKGVRGSGPNPKIYCI